MNSSFPNPVQVLGDALVTTWITVIDVLPSALLALVVFGLGWIVGSFAGQAVRHIIGLLRLDKVLHRIGLDVVSERAGFHVTIAGFFGSLVKWFIILAFTLAATEILGLDQVASLLSDVLLYVPQVFVAVLILIISVLLGDFVARLVEHSVKATGIHQAHFVGSIARWSIIVIAGVFPALTQLRIAQGLVEVLFTGVVFALSLSFGLAFGLGGRDAAARALDKMRNQS